jgi:hypothetical protein
MRCNSKKVENTINTLYNISCAVCIYVCKEFICRKYILLSIQNLLCIRVFSTTR